MEIINDLGYVLVQHASIISTREEGKRGPSPDILKRRKLWQTQKCSQCLRIFRALIGSHPVLASLVELTGRSPNSTLDDITSNRTVEVVTG